MIEYIVDISFLVCWLLIPLSWMSVLKIGGMRLLKISIPSFVVGFIFIFQYVGYPILYFQLDEYRAEFVTDKNLILKAWIITSISTLSICVGAFIASTLIGRLKYDSYFNSKYNSESAYSLAIVKLLTLICVAVLYSYISKVGLENIALILALQGAGVSELGLARSGMGNDFGAGYHWYNFFMKDLLIFISLILISQKLKSPVRVSTSILTCITILLIFSLTMATEKGLLVDYLIAIALVYVITQKKGEISQKIIYITALPIIIMLVMFYIVFMGDNNINSGLNSIISRALTGSMQPIYHYLEFFPKNQGFLYGTSFPNPGGLFPFEPYNLTVEVMNFVQPSHLESGVIGTMPAIYWGEIYANFGYTGLFIMPLYVGIALYIVNYIIFKIRYTPLSAGLFAWMLIHYKNLSITSLSVFVVDLNLYLIVFISLIIRIKISPSKKSLARLNKVAYNV